MIGIDNRCSATISHKIEDFVGEMTDSKRTISGFGGTKTAGLKRERSFGNGKTIRARLTRLKSPTPTMLQKET